MSWRWIRAVVPLTIVLLCGAVVWAHPADPTTMGSKVGGVIPIVVEGATCYACRPLEGATPPTLAGPARIEVGVKDANPPARARWTFASATRGM